MEDTIYFDKYTYLPEAGKLILTKLDGEEDIIRLAPQPNALLQLMIEAYPKVLNQTYIKEQLWPEVSVGYERSLHFCVRQIREALGDKAVNPTFIETIPKKGYRWIMPIQQNLTETSPAPRMGLKKILMWGFTFLLVLLALVFMIPKGTNGSEAPQTLRVAIMPFSAPTDHAFHQNALAEELLVMLKETNKFHDLQLIGPTTTQAYDADESRSLVRDLSIDCILNGRFIQREGKDLMLAEVIRASDGAHVWVQLFENPQQKNMAGLIGKGLKESQRKGYFNLKNE